MALARRRLLLQQLRAASTCALLSRTTTAQSTTAAQPLAGSTRSFSNSNGNLAKRSSSVHRHTHHHAERFEALVPALVTYAAVNGNDAVVPIDFVVPRAAPWPKRTWGLTLGISIANMRARTFAYASVLRADREQLQALGVWELLGLTATAPDDWNE